MFPMRVGAGAVGRIFDEPGKDARPNVSAEASAYLASRGESGEELFYHTVATTYSPRYRRENSGALRQDWPRIPLPDSKDALFASAELGKQIAALLDTESAVPGVTAGEIREELRVIAVPSREGGGNLDPERDLAVTAGWGHAGKGEVTMPGKGKAVERPVTAEEAKAVASHAHSQGTFDIYLNDVAYWKNVPKGVWEYTIGGYQVMKKWLSYREEALLGRPLKREEVQEVTGMARRIAAIILLEPELDANYERVKSAAYPWPGG